MNNLRTLASRSGTEAVIEARSTGVDICTIGQFRLCVILHILFRHNHCRPRERWQRTGLAQGEVRRWFLSPCKKTRRCPFFRRFRTVSMTRCSLSLWCDAGVNFSTDRTAWTGGKPCQLEGILVFPHRARVRDNSGRLPPSSRHLDSETVLLGDGNFAWQSLVMEQGAVSPRVQEPVARRGLRPGAWVPFHCRVARAGKRGRSVPCL